jgi:NADH dehydrogenase (ubiquinone) 1 alpha subcomplex subunit 9
LVNDLALAVFNALKLPETVGKMYELGGPNVYTMLEIYETIFNYIERPPKLVHFPK